MEFKGFKNESIRWQQVVIKFIFVFSQSCLYLLLMYTLVRSVLYIDTLL
jgi:hypothetical protein